VLQRCRDQFATNESLARLQDAVRHVASVLVPDIEHAGFYGFARAPLARFVRGGAVLAEGIQLRQPDPIASPTPIAGLPPHSHDCGINFAVDLSAPVQASNNLYALGVNPNGCAPSASAGGARAGSDTLTLRHASLAPARPHSGRLQLYSRRLTAHGPQELFADGHAPGPIDRDNEVRDVEVRSYYIANDSIGRAGWPALRVKALTEAGGVAQFRDEELLPGVEDLQVELAIAREISDRTEVRYVPPDFPTPPDARVIAVRLWLRIRSDATEGGFVDNRVLRYADVVFTPSAAEASHRRVLIERTVMLRNARLR
jgi:phage tail protein X